METGGESRKNNYDFLTHFPSSPALLPTYTYSRTYSHHTPSSGFSFPPPRHYGVSIREILLSFPPSPYFPYYCAYVQPLPFSISPPSLGSRHQPGRDGHQCVRKTDPFALHHFIHFQGFFFFSTSLRFPYQENREVTSFPSRYLSSPTLWGPIGKVA